MTVHPEGAIVTWRGQQWAVAGYEPNGGRPSSPDYRLVRPLGPDRFEAMTAAPGDVSLVEAVPTFTAGDKVKIGGLAAEVIEDNGGPTVTVLTGRRRELRGGGALRLPTTLTHAPRADLVAQNRI